jgi:hypothetical protein
MKSRQRLFWVTTTGKMLLPCLAGVFMASIGTVAISAIAFIWGGKDV